LFICLDLFSNTPGCIKLRLPINYQGVLILLIQLIYDGLFLPLQNAYNTDHHNYHHRMMMIIIHRHCNRIIITVSTTGCSKCATKERQGKGTVTRYVTGVGLCLAAKHQNISSGVRDSAPSRWRTATAETIIQKP
jgi:hypothetical protein